MGGKAVHQQLLGPDPLHAMGKRGAATWSAALFGGAMLYTVHRSGCSSAEVLSLCRYAFVPPPARRDGRSRRLALQQQAGELQGRADGCRADLAAAQARQQELQGELHTLEKVRLLLGKASRAVTVRRQARGPSTVSASTEHGLNHSCVTPSRWRAMHETHTGDGGHCGLPRQLPGGGGRRAAARAARGGTAGGGGGAPGGREPGDGGGGAAGGGRAE